MKRRKNSKLDLSSKNLLLLSPEHLHNPSYQFLKELRLSCNRLQDLPWDILARSLPTLRLLQLSKNMFSEIPAGIGLMTSLKQLYCDNNQIETISIEISKLTDLRKLYLQNNKLKHLPPEISQLISLTRLNLAHNNLKTLPPEMYQLTQLKSLIINDNPLISPPPFMVHKSTGPILHFLKQQYQSLHKQNAFRYNISGTFSSDQHPLQRSLDSSSHVTGNRKQHLSSSSVRIFLGERRSPQICVLFCSFFSHLLNKASRL